MKKVYPLALLLTLFFCSCGKDVLEKYDNKVIGTWRITEVKRVGFGGNASGLTFQNGTFHFFENGQVDHTNEQGALFKGTWDIERVFAGDHAHYQLKITVADVSGQQVLSETYDNVNFTGSTRFTARIFDGFRTYVTRFRR